MSEINHFRHSHQSEKGVRAHRTNKHTLLDILKHQHNQLKTFDQKVELMREILPSHAHLTEEYIDSRKKALRGEILKMRIAVTKHGGNMIYQDWLAIQAESDTPKGSQ